MALYLVQLDEPERAPIWFNKHHAWTNSMKFATALTYRAAQKVAAKERGRPVAKANPDRIISIIEAVG